MDVNEIYGGRASGSGVFLLHMVLHRKHNFAWETPEPTLETQCLVACMGKHNSPRWKHSILRLWDDAKMASKVLCISFGRALRNAHNTTCLRQAALCSHTLRYDTVLSIQHVQTVSPGQRWASAKYFSVSTVSRKLRPLSILQLLL